MAKSKHDKKVEKTVKWAEDQAKAVKEPAKPEFTHIINPGPAGHTMNPNGKTEEEKAEALVEEVLRAKTGRPPKYEARFKQMAKKAASLGATDLDLAELFDVAESTINVWKDKYHLFKESIDAGKDMIDDMVEKSLLNRALGCTVKETKVFCFEGAIVTEEIDKHFPPEVAAQKHWLNNRRPKEWRDKREVDFTSPLSIIMDDIDQETL